MQHAKEWYSEGLQFECTMCGNCCTGPPGFVLFTDDEAREISEFLSISVEDFLDRYTHQTSEGTSLNEVETEHGFDCVFLDRESRPGKAVCGLYEHRPSQCRTFPFWPEHLASPRAWKRLSRECEGIGRGDFVPIDRIRIQRDAQIQDRRQSRP